MCIFFISVGFIWWTPRETEEVEWL